MDHGHVDAYIHSMCVSVSEWEPHVCAHTCANSTANQTAPLFLRPGSATERVLVLFFRTVTPLFPPLLLRLLLPHHQSVPQSSFDFHCCHSVCFSVFFLFPSPHFRVFMWESSAPAPLIGLLLIPSSSKITTTMIRTRGKIRVSLRDRGEMSAERLAI